MLAAPPTVLKVVGAAFLVAAASCGRPAPVTLVFVGDVMLGRGIAERMERHADPGFSFRSVAARIRRADLALANLECVITDGTTGTPFRAHPRTLVGLVSAGFDVVSVANNHALDGGSAGLASTLTHLRAHGLAPTGALPHTGDQEPIVLRAGDLRVSFLAYTYNGTGPRGPVLEPALAGLDLPRLQAEIATARARSDYVVVALHMGYSRPRPTGEQRHFAHGAIDAGAHLVVGGHPHRPQELERYRGGLIAYSLGDFVFDHPGVSLDGAVLELTLDGTTPVRLALASTRMNEDFQPIVIREVVWDAAALRGPDGVLAAPAGGACNVWPLPCVIGSPCPRLPRSRPPFARASAGSGASATA